MKTIKNLLLVSGLVGSLALSGCGDKEKYQNFANFVKDKGEFTEYDRRYSLSFSINNQRYICNYYRPHNIENLISIMSLNEKSMDFFQDWNLDGLDNPTSKTDKEKYEKLIDRIPRWYEESKNHKK